MRRFAALLIASLALAGCARPQLVAFEPPPGYESDSKMPASFPIRLWQKGDHSLTLWATKYPMLVRQKGVREIRICGGHPALERRTAASKDSEAGMRVETKWGNRYYLAEYSHSDGVADDPQAIRAIHNVCPTELGSLVYGE